MIIGVSWKGGPHFEFENELEKLLGECDGSGCCCFGEITRDMQFDYKWKSKKEYKLVMANANALALEMGIEGFEMDDYT